MKITYVKIFIAAIILLPLKFWGQETPVNKNEKDGWAIHIGAGIMYGGNIGILTEKQFKFKDKFRISPFVSAGVGEAGTDSITSRKFLWFGYAAGLNLEYGNKHRVIFGPHVEGNNIIGNSEHIKKNFFSGLGIIAGYKGTAKFGLIWQVYIGDFYSPDDDPFSSNKNYSHRSQFGAGIGYKF